MGCVWAKQPVFFLRPLTMKSDETQSCWGDMNSKTSQPILGSCKRIRWCPWLSSDGRVRCFATLGLSFDICSSFRSQKVRVRELAVLFCLVFHIFHLEEVQVYSSRRTNMLVYSWKSFFFFFFFLFFLTTKTGFEFLAKTRRHGARLAAN